MIQVAMHADLLNFQWLYSRFNSLLFQFFFQVVVPISLTIFMVKNHPYLYITNSHWIIIFIVNFRWTDFLISFSIHFDDKTTVSFVKIKRKQIIQYTLPAKEKRPVIIFSVNLCYSLSFFFFFSLLLIAGATAPNMDNGLALKSNGHWTKKKKQKERKKEQRNEIHLSTRCCSSVFLLLLICTHRFVVQGERTIAKVFSF